MAKRVSTKNESMPDTQSSEERERCIAIAAYYRALERGFAAGDPLEDWLQAEREVDSRLLNQPMQRAEPVSPEQRA